jgi:phosphoglycerol geranylgeranyltransferase
MNLYYNILQAKEKGKKLLAVLLDPDKVDWDQIGFTIKKISQSPATHIFIGGSDVSSNRIDELVIKVKLNCNLPIILFPGHPSQVSPYADGILFLNLLSGRNPDFLVGYQVKAAPIIKATNLESIATGYLLIDGGSTTAVQHVTKTNPLKNNSHQEIVDTAITAELFGHKMVYLEAGSGASQAVSADIIKKVKKAIQIPVIVGGGIKNLQGIETAYLAGADMVVIGTAFENNPAFFEYA